MVSPISTPLDRIKRSKQCKVKTYLEIYARKSFNSFLLFSWQKRIHHVMVFRVASLKGSKTGVVS
jgi:hypothetical protein